MLAHRDSGVVQAALGEIDRLKVPLPRRRIQELLAADNPNIRWLALGWLAARPAVEDHPLVLPLLHDENTIVRERAKVYVDALEKHR
jgi:hypothetical protein